ncbi:MAG: GNAT family N-acetyltransferase [Promethearchaeota archaeon]
MIIREFSEKDIDEITTLMEKLCRLKGQEFDEERWRESIETRMKKDSNLKIIIAFDKNTEQVLGMGHFFIRDTDRGYKIGVISNLIVKEEKRREGIGETIMRQGIDYLKGCHIKSIRLALKNTLDNAAKKLFIKLGFEEVFKVYEMKI